nr:hypothetical protein HmN_000788300 [Hymenolepis microstoma]
MVYRFRSHYNVHPATAPDKSGQRESAMASLDLIESPATSSSFESFFVVRNRAKLVLAPLFGCGNTR